MEHESCRRNIRREEMSWEDDGNSVSVLYDFVSKNVSMPSDLGELVAYVLLLIITWYALVFAFRFVLSLVKPVLIVLVALFLFRFLRSFEIDDVVNLVLGILSLVFNLVSSIVAKFMEFILRILS
ncbi:uncharacterized protein LOC108106788 [Drosophila eugracilis]|uniref:uncharacterized protein LOC108106788 n=1 Tax=Drosophila eugracilis TaxID=29029 RepID=UPI0007E7774E|nr:uncharacterized protein LOC108106788 [Drosophila eugracilis]